MPLTPNFLTPLRKGEKYSHLAQNHAKCVVGFWMYNIVSSIHSKYIEKIKKKISLYLAGFSFILRAVNFIRKKEPNQVMVQGLRYFADTL